MLCPKDGQPCCDDLCCGSGCLRMNGYPMLVECDVCGGTVHRIWQLGDLLWATREHHTHACQHCGHVWRPAVACTVGVRFLPGFRNSEESVVRRAAQVGDVFPARGPGVYCWLVLAVKENGATVVLGLNETGEITSGQTYAPHVMERRERIGFVEGLDGLSLKLEGWLTELSFVP